MAPALRARRSSANAATARAPVRERVAISGPPPRRLEAREALGQGIEVGAGASAPGDHRLDEHRARTAERIEHERAPLGGRPHQAPGRLRMHPRRVGVKAVDVRAIGVVVGAALARRLRGGCHVERLGEPCGDALIARGLHRAADVRERSPSFHLSLRDGRSTSRAAA